MKYITWILLAALAMLQYSLWFHQGCLHVQYAQMEKNANNIKQQNDMLRRENEMLRAEVQDLENGFDTKAEIARSEMGYIGDGEIFYNLKPD